MVDNWCPLATWVDLKGPGAVPSTVIHRVMFVDAFNIADDTELEALANSGDDPPVPTDGVHSCSVDPGSKSTASERVKVLKAKALVKLLDAFAMERVLVFCRTNFDCQQLQMYVIRCSYWLDVCPSNAAFAYNRLVSSPVLFRYGRLL